ncbi:uncharacterized protein PV07_12798 [Cladophialophora immunda]|uniref:Uncharacterized protein n=1 Tax=Cladophialophora immunda TaxID=569365 RepID=A0A0D2CDX8_9EURO|nr:uncharacterized protein PV07_12798 [Cladophialophora immunda]KIW21774.1 hypothetical protein PV07_12798 [Cladophialophora immunda]
MVAALEDGVDEDAQPEEGVEVFGSTSAPSSPKNKRTRSPRDDHLPTRLPPQHQPTELMTIHSMLTGRLQDRSDQEVPSPVTERMLRPFLPQAHPAQDRLTLLGNSANNSVIHSGRR